MTATTPVRPQGRRWMQGAMGCLALLLLSAAVPAGQPLRPRLVLVLSIDQMRYDYLERFDDLFTGGLRTLLDRGAVFTNARYRHTSTETGPGHSVIMSGRHPSSSGIVANDWYDRHLGRAVNVVDDPAVRPVGGEGRAASPAHLNGLTVGDALKTSSPQSRVIGVSAKDRSAILMAGRRGDAAYWYEIAGGRFITSSYYTDTAPDWLERWNARKTVDAYAGKRWTRLLPDVGVYERYAGPDDVGGEWDTIDTVFPHRIRNAPPARAFYDDFRRTPFSDEVTLDVALEAMRAHALGTDQATDVLAVGLSATDVVGHTYGPDSQEVLDQLLRLDRLLGRLFEEVDAQVGSGGTLVVLTADHGVMPLVETLQARGLPARRVDPRQVRQALDTALSQAFPSIDGIVASFVGDVYLDGHVIDRNRLDRRRVERVVVDALLSTGVFERVLTRDEILRHRLGTDPAMDLIRNAYYQPRSGDIVVQLKPYVYLDPRVGGTGHGSAHDYDRHVPIVFLGEGIRAGAYGEPAGPEDIAPTLARLLGFDYPLEWDSRVLVEMLREAGPSEPAACCAR